MNDLLIIGMTIVIFAVFFLLVKAVEQLSAENWVGLIAAIVLTIYLVYALVRPERF